jgi:hypothetical protein
MRFHLSIRLTISLSAWTLIRPAELGMYAMSLTTQGSSVE